MSIALRTLLILSLVYKTNAYSSQFQIEDEWSASLPNIKRCSGPNQPYLCKINHSYEFVYNSLNHLQEIGFYAICIHLGREVDQTIRASINRITAASSYKEIIIVLHEETLFYGRYVVIFVFFMALSWWLGFGIGALCGYVCRKYQYEYA